MSSVCIRTYLYLSTVAGGLVAARVSRSERGQASAEYALVLLGAAAVAFMLGKWALQEDTLGRVFKSLLDKILGGVGSAHV